MNYTLDSVAALIRMRQPEITVERVDGPDARNYRVSFEKIHNRLGFGCKVTLEQGIDELRTAFVQGAVDPYGDGVCQPPTFLTDKPAIEAAKFQALSVV